MLKKINIIWLVALAIILSSCERYAITNSNSTISTTGLNIIMDGNITGSSPESYLVDFNLTYSEFPTSIAVCAGTDQVTSVSLDDNNTLSVNCSAQGSGGSGVVIIFTYQNITAYNGVQNISMLKAPNVTETKWGNATHSDNTSHVDCSDVGGGSDPDYCADDTGAGGAAVIYTNDNVTAYLGAGGNGSIQRVADAWDLTNESQRAYLNKTDNQTITTTYSLNDSALDLKITANNQTTTANIDLRLLISNFASNFLSSYEARIDRWGRGNQTEYNNTITSAISRALNFSTAFAGDISGTYLTTSVDNTKCTSTDEFLDGTGTCRLKDGLDDFSNVNTKFTSNLSDAKFTNFTVVNTNTTFGSLQFIEFNSSCSCFRRSTTGAPICSCG